MNKKLFFMYFTLISVTSNAAINDGVCIRAMTSEKPYLSDIARNRLRILGNDYYSQLKTDLEESNLSYQLMYQILILAAASGNISVVDLISEQPNIDTNIQDEDGYTPLIWAAMLKKPKIVKKLLEQPTTYVNWQGDKYNLTALHWAVINDDIESVKYLIKQPDIDTTIQDSYGETAYTIAKELGNKKIINILGTPKPLRDEFIPYLSIESIKLRIHH